MKLFFYNDRLNQLDANGSFTVSSRNLNQAAIDLGHYSPAEKADHIIFMDALDINKTIFNKKAISFLVSEYNFAPKFLIPQLAAQPIALAISQQAKNSFVNAGADPDKIHVVHLGSDPKMWVDFKQRQKAAPFTFLTINSSNNRSAFEILIPAFLEWAAGKNVRLIIKDQQNDKLQYLINQIDKEKKILYIGQNLNYNQLLNLINQCHAHLYINSTTSFGMTPLDTSLAGLPQILSNSSALPEFTSDEFVTYVDCYQQEVNELLLGEYRTFGLVNNLLPLENYNSPLLTARPRAASIINKLQYCMDNYLELVNKNEKYKKWILANKTWHNSIKEIVKILK